MDSNYLRYSALALLLPVCSGTAFAATPVTPPAEWTFESGTDGCTVINTDPSTETFEHVSWAKYMRYYGSYGEVTDDYLVLPSLSLRSGKMYQVSYSAYASWYRFDWNPTLAWVIGKEPTADSLSSEIAPGVTFESSYDPESHSFTFSVGEDGDYYLAALLTADEAQGSCDFYITEIAIDAGAEASAPASPALTVTPTIKDARLAMEISVTMPDRQLDGNALTGSVEYSVQNATGRFSHSGSADPGSTVTITDTECDVAGETYNASASCNGKAGKSATVSCKPVFDRPSPPRNLQISESDGQITLTWDPVTEGASGGLFIPSGVVYSVQRSDRVMIANKVSSTTVTDTPPAPEAGQSVFHYTVTAYHDASAYGGTSSDSPDVTVGKPYGDPFTESFADGRLSTNTWTFGPEDATSSAWQPATSSYSSPYCTQAADDDGGFLLFNPSYYDGTEYLSPVIDLSQAQAPAIELHIFRHQEAPAEALVRMYIDRNGVRIPVENGELQFKSDNDRWEKLTFRLPEESVHSPFRLVLEGMKINGMSYKALIDAIKIYDRPATDAALTSISIPERLLPGDTAAIGVIAANTGMSDLEGVKVQLDVAGHCYESETFGLPDGETHEHIFNIYINPFMAGSEQTFTATVAAPGDLKETNNICSAETEIGFHKLPAVSVLRANHVADGVLIEWEAPVIDNNPSSEEVSESFESWSVGSTEPLNGWIFIDADKKDKNGLAGVNQDSRYAFFVADRFSTSAMASIEAPDGNNVLVTTRNSDYSYTDSWLISPVFDPSQPVSFCASGIGFRGLDSASFEVGYFTAGKSEPDDFVKLQDVETGGYSWETVTLKFPFVAERFVIHTTDVQTNAYAFDMFRYHALPETPVLTGYNIWRNGDLIGSLDPETVSHKDPEADKSRDNLYHVSCIYTPSREVVDQDGFKLEADINAEVTQTISDNTGFSLSDNTLTSSQEYTVYNMEGLRIGTVKPGAGMYLPKGIYMLNAGMTTHKLIVR